MGSDGWVVYVAAVCCFWICMHYISVIVATMAKHDKRKRSSGRKDEDSDDGEDEEEVDADDDSF